METDKYKIQANIFLTAIMSLTMLYFVYHIFAGNYGIISFIKSRDTLSEKQKIVESMQKDLEFRKNKIKTMNGPYIYADILDEEIRKTFGFAKKNEIVIYSKDLEQ
jgi:cell division protein FtsB